MTTAHRNQRKEYSTTVPDKGHAVSNLAPQSTYIPESRIFQVQEVRLKKGALGALKNAKGLSHPALPSMHFTTSLSKKKPRRPTSAAAFSSHLKEMHPYLQFKTKLPERDCLSTLVLPRYVMETFYIKFNKQLHNVFKKFNSSLGHWAKTN